MTKWKPIRTAPKWEVILLTDGHRVALGSWSGVMQSFEGLAGGDFVYTSPTHWMPLPDPPVQP